MHFAEFAALQLDKYDDAVDMDIIVRKKPFREGKQTGFVNNVDSDDAYHDTATRWRWGFLGGGGESDGDEKDDTEGDIMIMRQTMNNALWMHAKPCFAGQRSREGQHTTPHQRISCAY